MSERKLKPKVLREMSPEERRELLNQLRAELVKLQTQRSRGFVEKPGRIRQIKRIIARILTIERELELAEEREKAKKSSAKT